MSSAIATAQALFILHLGVASGLILGLVFLRWWLPSIDLGNIHPSLPLSFGALLGIDRNQFKNNIKKIEIKR